MIVLEISCLRVVVVMMLVMALVVCGGADGVQHSVVANLWYVGPVMMSAICTNGDAVN